MFEPISVEQRHGINVQSAADQCGHDGSGESVLFSLRSGKVALCFLFNEPFHNKGSVFHNLIELRRVFARHMEREGEFLFPSNSAVFLTHFISSESVRDVCPQLCTQKWKNG